MTDQPAAPSHWIDVDALLPRRFVACAPAAINYDGGDLCTATWIDGNFEFSIRKLPRDQTEALKKLPPFNGDGQSGPDSA